MVNRLSIVSLLALSACGDVSVRGIQPCSISIEFWNNLQEPFSARFMADVYPQLVNRYGSNLQFIPKSMPLPFMEYSYLASQAVECAGDQTNPFTYVHRAFFTYNRNGPDRDQLLIYARDIDLNIDEFARCLDSGEKSSVVEATIREFQERDLSGLPTFFLPGARIDGSHIYAVFSARIDEEGERCRD